jgi:S1-C subfamily serine protease
VGIVSALEPGGGDRAIETTAPIEPGASGGPLLDPRGHAIGMTVDRRDAIGGALAIPIGSVETALQRLAPPTSSPLADTLGRRLGEAGEPRVLRP